MNNTALYITIGIFVVGFIAIGIQKFYRSFLDDIRIDLSDFHFSDFPQGKKEQGETNHD